MNPLTTLIKNTFSFCFDIGHNWISFIIQNSIGKTSIVLVLTGRQGAGKT